MLAFSHAHVLRVAPPCPGWATTSNTRTWDEGGVGWGPCIDAFPRRETSYRPNSMTPAVYNDSNLGTNSGDLMRHGRTNDARPDDNNLQCHWPE